MTALFKKIFTATLLLPVFIGMLNTEYTYAQAGAEDFRDEFLNQFEYASDRILALAEAMPEDTYTWSPDGEAMTVARVYMHIARYNYLLPETSLGIESPDDINLDTMEEITDKEDVLRHLERSTEHLKTVIEELSESDLEARTELYGRDVEGWTVLFQLQTHMSEHIGQSIAYARMNDVIPPWSE